MLATEQYSHYEAAYRVADGEYGMPDRKIVNGSELRGKRVLVVGCGAGTDVWYLAQDNEVFGVDYSCAGLEVAARHGLNVSIADLNSCCSLPFDDRYFDVIVCKDILEHLLDPLAVLKELVRVLRDSGYIVISVPNQFYLPTRVRMLFGSGVVYRSLLVDHARSFDEWNYMHIRFFTYRGFRRFLKAAGLEGVRWFWDFGTLAHYHQPEMWFEPQIWKKEHGFPISSRARRALSVIRPLWTAFNVFLPRRFRRRIVSLAPGVLCAGFYVHCRICVGGRESR